MDTIIALALVGAHATYLYTGYNAILVGGTDAWLSPVIPAVCSVAYLACVTVGVRVMKGRASFPAMKGSMVVYNLYSTVLSGLMLALYARSVDWRAPFTAPFARGAAWRAAEAVFWLNYHAKFLEYADTFFMIARGKFEQVSSLHVIHHAEMGPLMWYYLTRFHGANTCFGPMINCFIHLLMYAYYGFTGIGIKLDFIKVVMTSSQMLQFLVILVHSVFHLAQPNVYWPQLLAGIQTLLMIQCVRARASCRHRARRPLTALPPHLTFLPRPGCSICLATFSRARACSRQPRRGAPRAPCA